MSQINTILDGIQLKLSNLDKVLWPDEGITKAELIQYYLSVYKYIQKHISGRPLTLIRYPDGINGNKFYSKNAPDHTPDWVPKTLQSDITYIYTSKSADLIYLANLASLELHAMTHVVDDQGRPNTMIFDLDPDVGFDFDALKIICKKLVDHLTNLGYHPHIKTSGGKGLHIYVPLLPNYSQDEVFNCAKLIGQEFINKNPECTLKISKEKRVGKILIDIYRNHQSQTCVAALSTRAKPGAPVSMPILLEDLNDLKSSSQFNIKNAIAYLDAFNPWENYLELATRLHTDIGSNTISETKEKDETNLIESKLEPYNQKRNFEKTSEPSPEPTKPSASNRYVIQMHDATNLHYDLRIEENGVLTSWAIPKSLPTLQGIKRLAIRTEDHPIKYLDFEGIIPSGEYGGGTMWIYDQGKYELIKKTEDSYKIRLYGGDIQGEYSLFKTKENQWIVELKSEDKKMNSQGFMLADQVVEVPLSSNYFFELKWDGIRVSAVKEGDTVKLLSKSGRDISSQFPEIIEGLKKIEVEVALFDGEIVCLDNVGKPIFANVISRMHTKSFSAIQSSIKSNPSVLYVFDCRYLDGKNCENLHIERRQEWINLLIKKSEHLRVSEVFDDGASLFEAAKSMGLEGIMAKRKESKYQADKRSKDWLKIKVRNILDVQIIGYTKGKGDRSPLLGSIHVATNIEGVFKYMGKVGTGFNEATLKEMFDLLSTKQLINKPIQDIVEEEYNSTWIADGPTIEVQYASITPNGTLREPVFFRIKSDE